MAGIPPLLGKRNRAKKDARNLLKKSARLDTTTIHHQQQHLITYSHAICI